MFIIPKLTFYKIEQIFNGFLWSSKEGNARRAKVGRKSICLPREEGGLGLRRVKDWNDATIMKHIWNLFYRKDYLGSLGSRRFCCGEPVSGSPGLPRAVLGAGGRLFS